MRLIGALAFVAALIAGAWYANLWGQPSINCRMPAGASCPSENAAITWVGMAGRPTYVEAAPPLEHWAHTEDPALHQAQWSAYVERVPGEPVLAGCYTSTDVGGPMTCHVTQGEAVSVGTSEDD